MIILYLYSSKSTVLQNDQNTFLTTRKIQDGDNMGNKLYCSLLGDNLYFISHLRIVINSSRQIKNIKTLMTISQDYKIYPIYEPLTVGNINAIAFAKCRYSQQG